MKPLKISIPIVLSDEDIFESLVRCDYSDIHNFICRLDLAVADVEFTEELIIILLKSLRGEYKKEPEEFYILLKDILSKASE